MKTLLVATTNQGKIKEIKDYLGNLDIKIISLEQVNFLIYPEENGQTYAENALIKAKAWALKSGIASLADDSGLEVDYLNGKPGIFSARFAPNDEKRNLKILKLLKKSNNRKANFTAVLAFYDPVNNLAKNFEGKVYGKISLELEGDFGFGYDPIFIPNDYEHTFAYLGSKVKYKIGHRAIALEKLKAFLQEWIKS